MRRSSAGSRTWSAAWSSLAALVAVAGLSASAMAADPGTGEQSSSAPEQQAANETNAGNDAAPQGGEGEVRAMGGTSVIGNREVPKSLYIVPWKNSEVGVRTDVSRDLLDEGLAPVDPQEFERQVDYYQHHQKQ